MKLIKCHIEKEDAILINADLIETVDIEENENGTMIQMISGQTIYVKESLEKVEALINNVNREYSITLTEASKKPKIGNVDIIPL